MPSSRPGPTRITLSDSHSGRPRKELPVERMGRGARFLQVLAAAAAVLMTASGLTLAGAAGASAQEQTDVVTGIRINETEIDTGFKAMRLDLDFTLGLGSDLGGSVHEGDTFWAELDPRLTAQNGTFNIYAEEDPSEIVATVEITGQNLATFTLTDYAQGRTSTDGSAFWAASFKNASTPAGDYNLVFTTNDHQFQDGVLVVNTYTPGTNLQPIKYGAWGSSAQRSGVWLIRLPNGQADTMVFEDFGHVDGPGWEFDCAAALANAGGNARRVTAPAHEVSFECTSDHVRWELADVPRYTTGGNSNFPRLTVNFDVTDPSTSGDLVFVNTAQYMIDDGTPNQLDGEVRQSRGGQATGPTVPLFPTVTQATCSGGTLTAPSISLPQNGNGITYSIEDDDYAAGDSVDVIGKLSSGFSWDTADFSPGWNVNGDGDAVLTVVLDAPPCASAVLPAAPEVVQAACIAGTGNLTTPTVTTTNSTEIHYETVGDVEPGESVQVIAQIQDKSSYEWDDDLPSGWTVNGDGDAVLTVVLDAPPCASALLPIAPAVTQVTCIAGTGDLTAPTVTATDTNEIDYRVVGDLEPGASVQVIAEIQDTTSYEWDDDLPSGWSVNGDGDAVLTVVLDSPPCATVIVPVQPDVTQAVCVAGTGDLTAPTVIATETAEIHYRVVGDVQAGETVQILAEIQNTALYEWDNELPTGWSVNGDGFAVQSIALDARLCLPAGNTPPGTPPGSTPPGDTPPGPDESAKESLTKTGSNETMLPLGLAIAGSLLGAGVLILRRRRVS